MLFANDVVANLPTSGVNLVVLQTLDNDANSATPFGAGNAANLIADQITSPGPGFFVYFNSGLDLPRLVFSTELSDNTADLKILARMTNLAGQSAALPTFTAANFTMIPEPTSFLLMTAAIALWACIGTVRQGLTSRQAVNDCAGDWDRTEAQPPANAELTRHLSIAAPGEAPRPSRALDQSQQTNQHDGANGRGDQAPHQSAGCDSQ